MIKKFLLHILANAAALYIVVQVLGDDFLITGGWKGYAIAALIFGILNGFVKPILKIITLPFVFITAGLFTLVINMFLVWFAKYSLGILQFEGISIVVAGGLMTYLYVGIIMAIVNMVIQWLVRN
jgi:putative membrane protein